MEDLPPETRRAIRRRLRFRRLRTLRVLLLPQPGEGKEDAGGGPVPYWLAVRIALLAMLIAAAVPLATLVGVWAWLPMEALALSFAARSLQLTLRARGLTFRDLWRGDDV